MCQSITQDSKPEYEAVRKSLKEVGLESVFGLLLRFGGRANDLRPWLEDAQINRDYNLRLQYIARL